MSEQSKAEDPAIAELHRDYKAYLCTLPRRERRQILNALWEQLSQGANDQSTTREIGGAA